ncbi:MAG: transglutaminase-like domain-containing protein [Chitinophagaceae bacterium]
MIRKSIIVWATLLLTKAGFSQTGLYTLASVPEALKAKAVVVTHLEDYNYEIESLDKAWLSVRKAFTVINEEGKGALLFNEYSSRDVLLDEAEIKVYDGSGKKIGRYTKKDMHTVATGEGLIEDGFVTYYMINAPSYPVTVELNYVKKFKSTLVVPDYRFISPRESIVSSSYTAKIPAGINIRFKPFNTDIQPAVSDKGKFKEYKWNVKDLAPLEYEEGAVSARSRYPHIAIIAEQFSHYGFKGELSSWKSFGNWISDLYKGLDELPADRQQFYASLVKDIPDETDKIRKIYQYMQQNFRYVSIQLGIGGLKPFSATFTDQKKYGDCKGLSNFMKAALKSVGIRSHVAIINAQYNEEPVDPDFPANNFNHVILCIPGKKDSIWLECTSSTAFFGELGTFTENRNALLITEEGGVLVPTPKSKSEANLFTTHTVVTLKNDFSGSSETRITTKGAFSQYVNSSIKEKKDRQKQFVVNYWGFKQPDDFVLAREEEAFRLKMEYGKVHEFNSGDKLFLSPRLQKLWTERLPKADNRKLDYYFEEPFEKRDTTIYKLPAGVKPDALPQEKQLKCDYASFQTKCWYNEPENAIYVASALVLSQYKIPAAKYASVKKFFEDVSQDDSQKLVVKKGETTLKAF